MKKLLSGWIALALVLGFLAAVPHGRAEAQDATPAPTAVVTAEPSATRLPVPGDPNVVSFPMAGFTETVLHGPFDTMRLTFGLPGDWQLVGGAELQLDLAIFFGGVGVAPTTPEAPPALGGSLEVTFNDVLLTTILLDQTGHRTLAVPIPVEALTPTRSDGRHSLSLTLDSGLSCEFNGQTNVAVRPTSLFYLPHATVAPSTDLTRLPRPVFQNTFLPDSAVVVVPAQPTAGDLQAALAVAAGFGRMTGGQLVLSLAPEDRLTPGVRDANHLIFVGAPGAFTTLGGAGLPAPIAGANFDVPGASPDDGVIQMIVSPWNASKVLMVVGGNSEAGVIKAGQAVSTGAVRVGDRPDLALVAEVQPGAGTRLNGTDQTLSDLGYADVVVDSIGINTIDFLLHIPAGQLAGPDAYLDLAFAHSALVEYDRSGLIVNLNGQPIGSASLSAETAGQGKVHVNLPSSALAPGANRIEVEVDLVPRTACVDPRLTRLWFRVDTASSKLHVPLSTAPGTFTRIADLDEYPAPFTLDSVMGNVAFVLAPNDPAGWNVALQIASGLGDQGNPALADLAAHYVDSVPDEVRQTRDLLVVGRPSTLPLIAELTDSLPAPFESGSDLAVERNLLVAYRVLPGVSIGYLELATAPWNPQRTVLAVLGSTDQGVQWAGAALTVPRLRGQLAGNFAAVRGEQIVVSDTRTGRRGGAALATALPGNVIQVDISEPPIVNRPAWILPAMGVAGLLMLVVLAITLAAALRRRRAAR